MPNYTEYYNLKKPLPNENYNIEDQNSNMDLIDGALNKIAVKSIEYAVANGTNTYTASISGITSLTEGLSIKVKFTNANTGASTLNINGLGAKEIRKSNGNTLVSDNIKAGQICHLVYDGVNFQLLGEGGEYGTAQPEHVLEGYTIGTEEGIKIGEMPNNGSQTDILTINGASKPTKNLPQGFITGGTITAQVNSNQAQYIKKGYTLGGCVGELEPLVSPKKAMNLPFSYEFMDSTALFSFFVTGENELVYSDNGTLKFYNFSGTLLRSFNTYFTGGLIHYDKFRNQILVYVHLSDPFDKLSIFNLGGTLISTTANFFPSSSTRRCVGATKNNYLVSYETTAGSWRLRSYNLSLTLINSRSIPGYGNPSMMIGFEDCVVHYTKDASGTNRHFVLYDEDLNYIYEIPVGLLLGIK